MTRSSHGGVPHRRLTTARSSATVIMTESPTTITRRAPNRSPTAPPSSSSAIRGNVTAVNTRAAMAPPCALAAQPSAKYMTASPSNEARVPASQRRYVRGSAGRDEAGLPVSSREVTDSDPRWRH
ncbi:hypothetical protein [Streptomyces sp. B6B3]|uniref:hypothetical protein n=1 Tax=Streptomyces sp. B6B3 TaxID=3153570 RepID=UPI00325F3250